jgi:hypothetical protein
VIQPSDLPAADKDALIAALMARTLFSPMPSTTRRRLSMRPSASRL